MKLLLTFILSVVSLNSFATEPVFHTSKHYAEAGYPFSSAVQVGDMLFLSGTLGTDPETDKLVEGGIGPETRQTMDNIGTILTDYGSNFAHVVKCTVFMTDMSEWAEMSAAYKSYFQAGRYPARSAVQVSRLAAGARVEIECIAALADEE